jgi:7-keto-8-aminopelargonate synthetase-like enzyme
MDRTYVRFRSTRLSYFSGCDYFRLSSHPQVLAALHKGAKRHGLNVAASRLTTGNHALYEALERQLVHFFGAEDALLTSTGYLANLVAAQALAGGFSHALVDAKAHPSLLDAARLLECPIVQFAHRSASELTRAVSRCGPEAKLILLTDGMFAHDGSAAPLNEYLEVLPKDAMLLVDDAHGAGVLGATGKGTPEHAGISRRRVVQTVTLSKAFGTYGGAILSTPRFRQQILAKSTILIGSTPLPLPLASAASAALTVLKKDKRLRQHLAWNTNYVKTALHPSGGTQPPSPGPIVPIKPSTKEQMNLLRRALFAAKIFPPFIKYPGAPAAGYFRFSLSSEHTREQLDRLVGVLRKVIAD